MIRRGVLKAIALGLALIAVVYTSLWHVQKWRIRPAQCTPSPPAPSVVYAAEEGPSCVRRFPHAVIIGVRKGGTRALIDMLALHPRISVARQEVHYFDNDTNFAKGVQWYIDRMPLTTDIQITMEKTPSYFVTPNVPQRMSTLLPRVKLILIVRDPVERLVSDYAQLLANRDKRTRSYSLEEKAFNLTGHVNPAWPAVACGMYDVHVGRWLRHFEKKQLHVVSGERLVGHPLGELRRVEAFLGLQAFFREEMFVFNVTKGFYCWIKDKDGGGRQICLGDGKGRPHPFVSRDTLSRLKDFYQPHNRLFYELTGVDFRW